MDAIVIRNVTKHFKRTRSAKDLTTLKTELVRFIRGQWKPRKPVYIEALKGIDLVIPAGKTVGIVGRNGSGKSTLLKVLTGIYAPSSGAIQINGRVSALLDLGAGFHPDFTGRENILINGIILGMSRADVRARMDEIIAFSELGDFIDEPVRTYSSGMYMRLAFAVATHVDPDILIIDEILAVGDEHFTRKCQAKMDEFKKAGKTIVLVTHDLGTLQSWCDLAAWIDGGRIRALGDPRKVVAEYREAVALAEAQLEKTGTSALSAPGLELPQLAAPRAEASPLALEAVRLTTASGGPTTAVDPEDGLALEIDFRCNSPVGASFGISIVRADGTLIYGTSTRAEAVPLPDPLPEAGTLRLSLARVGLTAGDYSIDVTAERPDGSTYEKRSGACAFTVQSKVKETGLARPAHGWSLQPRALPEVAPAA